MLTLAAVYAVSPVLDILMVYGTVPPGVLVPTPAEVLITSAGIWMVTTVVHDGAGLPLGHVLPGVGETTVLVSVRSPTSGLATRDRIGDRRRGPDGQVAGPGQRRSWL